MQPDSERSRKVRRGSFVSFSALALTVATAELFAHDGVPLRSNWEYAVVGGFWLMTSLGGLWLWRKIHRSRNNG
jgi:ABC-type nickel/cobalt efflux system permease component RcnA